MKVIELTLEDIREGEQGNCWRCPVARALARAGYRVYVTDDSVWLLNHVGDWITQWLLGPRLFGLIEAFDQGTTVYPTRLLLDETQRLIVVEGDHDPLAWVVAA